VDSARFRNAVAQTTVAKVGSLHPTALLPEIKRWQNYTYGSDEPYFYAAHVERAALFADFAVWIPWGVKPTDPVEGGHSATRRTNLPRSLAPRDKVPLVAV